MASGKWVWYDLAEGEIAMPAITFDTLAYANRLKSAGIPEQHANAMAEAQKDSLSEAMDTTLATKGDIARLEAQLLVIKWMAGILVVGVTFLVLNAFFIT